MIVRIADMQLIPPGNRQYQDGVYLCNGTKRVEAPLNLDTLEEAVRQCPKLQQVLLNDAPFDDQCFSILARIPKLNMLTLMRGRQITGHRPDTPTYKYSGQIPTSYFSSHAFSRNIPEIGQLWTTRGWPRPHRLKNWKISI